MLGVQVVVLADVGPGPGGSGAVYRVATPEAAASPHPGPHPDAKTAAAAAASGGKKGKAGGAKERSKVSSYKETISTSQPNALDTMRPTAGECSGRVCRWIDPPPMQGGGNTSGQVRETETPVWARRSRAET